MSLTLIITLSATTIVCATLGILLIETMDGVDNPTNLNPMTVGSVLIMFAIACIIALVIVST